MYHLVKSLYLHATSQPEYSILLLGLDGAGKTTLHNQIKALYGGPSTSSSSSSSQSNPFAASTSTKPSASNAPTPPTFTRKLSKPFLDPVTSPSSTTTTTKDTTSSSSVSGASSTAGNTVPTVGQNVSTVTLPDCYLRIWDVGGQHALRGLWQGYYARCHAVVFVLDSTDVGDGELTAAGFAHGIGSNSSSSSSSRGATSVDEEEDVGRLEEAALVLESILRDADAEGVPLLVLANKQDREDSVEVVRIKEGFVRRVVEGGTGGAGVRDSRVLACSALTGKGVREAVEWVSSRVKWNREARPGVLR